MNFNLKFLKKLFCLLFFSVLFINTYAQQQPIPDWVKDIGGTGESKLSGIAVDKFDNVYVCGNFQNTLSVDLSGISTVVDLSSNGDYDIYIAKYTPDGKLLWAKSIGGDGLDQANNLAVDEDGNVIIAASFNSSSIDCDPGAGVANINNSGSYDAIVVKLDPNGNYLWARNVGGAGIERGHVVTTDKLGNVILVGAFTSPSITLGTFQLNCNTNFDGFMAKYDKNGNILWAYSLSSSSIDEIKSVKTNSNNEVIVMGYFGQNTNLNPKGPAHNITTNTQTYFISKYSETGDLIWVNKIDGNNSVTVSSIAIGPTNDIYLTGGYISTINFNAPGNTLTLNAPGAKYLFVTKYSNSGNALWAKNITSTSSNPYSYYITADLEDNIYIGGYFDGTLTFGNPSLSKTLTFHGGQDTFFGKYNSTGDYIWAFNFGSACNGNFGHKIAVDSKKNVLLGGAFCSTVDFNPGSCDLNLTAKNGNSDGFISKYNQIKLSGEPIINSFSLPEQLDAATIDIPNKKITIKVKPGTNLTKLKPQITTDIGILFPLSDIETDFTLPKTYKITSNCIDYNWIVEVLFGDNEKISLCSAMPMTITGNAANNQNGAIYLWQVKNSEGNWINAPNASQNVNYDFKGLENYTSADISIELRRKVTVNNTNVYDSQVSLVIHPSTTNNIISTPQVMFCTGKISAIITGLIPQGAENLPVLYKWQQSNDGVSWTEISSATLKDLSITDLDQSKYFKRVSLSGNCESYSNILKIEFSKPLTIANAGNDLSLCGDLSLTLNANSPNENEIGSWSVISPLNYNPFSESNLHDPKIRISDLPQNEQIILEWRISNNCNASSSSQITITTYESVAIAAPEILTINFGQKINLNVSANISTNLNYTIEWSPKLNLNQYNILSPEASPSENTDYTLNIRYGSNCLASRTIKVIVLNSVEAPKAFSPNGDNYNDLWVIKNIANYPSAKVSVYNRYGSVLFQTSSYLNNWDGTQNGKLLPPGVYYYVIVLNNKKNTVMNGALSLIY